MRGKYLHFRTNAHPSPVSDRPIVYDNTLLYQLITCLAAQVSQTGALTLKYVSGDNQEPPQRARNSCLCWRKTSAASSRGVHVGDPRPGNARWARVAGRRKDCVRPASAGSTRSMKLDGPRARKICLIPRRLGTYSGANHCNHEELSVALSASRRDAARHLLGAAGTLVAHYEVHHRNILGLAE
jgi:hypothetical protein